MRNLLHSLQIELGFLAGTINNAVLNGPAVDCGGALDALLIASVGNVSGGAVASIKVQESADGSTGWADVSLATVTTADDEDNTVNAIRVHCPNHKRYLRAVGVETGSFNFVVGAVWAISPQVCPPTAPTLSVDADAIA